MEFGCCCVTVPAWFVRLILCAVVALCFCLSLLTHTWVPMCILELTINPQAGIARGEEIGRDSKQPSLIHTNQGSKLLSLPPRVALSWPLSSPGVRVGGTGTGMSAQCQGFMEKNSVQQNAVCVRWFCLELSF